MNHFKEEEAYNQALAECLTPAGVVVLKDLAALAFVAGMGRINLKGLRSGPDLLSTLNGSRHDGQGPVEMIVEHNNYLLFVLVEGNNTHAALSRNPVALMGYLKEKSLMEIEQTEDTLRSIIASRAQRHTTTQRTAT